MVSFCNLHRALGQILKELNLTFVTRDPKLPEIHDDLSENMQF